MSSSPAQIRTSKAKGINADEKSIPWSQQVDEATNDQFVSLECTVHKISESKQSQYNTLESSSKCNKNMKIHDFQNIDLIASKQFHNTSTQRMKQENEKTMRSCNKISTNKDFSLVKSKSILSEHYSVAFEKSRNDVVDFKKTTWASIASQPIKSVFKGSTTMTNHKKKGPGMPPPPMVPGKHNMNIASWELPKNNTLTMDLTGVEKESVEKTIDNFSSFMIDRTINLKLENKLQRERQESFDGQIANASSYEKFIGSEVKSFINSQQKPSFSPSCFIEEPIEIATEQKGTSYSLAISQFKEKKNYNPQQLSLEMATLARFFVIKSYSEDDIHRSIKYEIWCSTDHGNKRLDDAFKERLKKGGSVLLFFSVNGSGHFCGIAQMMTSVDYNTTASVWSQDKWKGKFKVKWIYVKDVPNGLLRHIKLENNDNKSVTNSRDTQEVPNSKGIQVLKIIHSYKHQTSIFDDFYHYEKKQEEEISKKPSDYSISKHSTQNKMFSEYYKNKNLSERHGDYYTNHKKVYSVEKDNANSSEVLFHGDTKINNKGMQKLTDYNKEDKNFKHNKESNLSELREENRVGSCPPKSNKVR